MICRPMSAADYSQTSSFISSLCNCTNCKLFMLERITDIKLGSES